MAIRAVIFDLFGTLVDNWPVAALNDLHAWVAARLGAPAEPFIREWLDTWDARNRGDLPTLADNLCVICQRLGLPEPSPTLLAEIEQHRLQVARRMFVVRPDAVPTLQSLKSRGLRLGMISDCSWEVPVVWRESPLAPLFDAAVFSVTARLKKPDRRIYELICQHLGVVACECAYVGDGGSRELSGAAAVGMRAIMIRTPHDQSSAVHRMDGEDWPGETISALSQLLDLL